MESTGPLLGAPPMAELKNAAYADGDVICQFDHNNDKQGNGGHKIEFSVRPGHGGYLSTVANSLTKSFDS